MKSLLALLGTAVASSVATLVLLQKNPDLVVKLNALIVVLMDEGVKLKESVKDKGSEAASLLKEVDAQMKDSLSNLSNGLKKVTEDVKSEGEKSVENVSESVDTVVS